MSLPRIEITPIRPAVRSDATVTVELLITVTPPDSATPLGRVPLNLGLVLDRSGSMEGQNKMGFAREAAIFAVQQLRATDRVSVTTFDEQVESIAPNGPAENKARLATLIGQIRPRGSTDLHGGWAEGAKQVGSNLVKGGLNRVLLLSDGLANHGETNPDAIAGHVARMRHESVSTTTMGVGADYNEKLLEAMGRAGDGNYYFIQSANQLTDIFQSELRELLATFGTAVSLGIEPSEGVTVADVLNDYDRLPTGRYKLPQLIAGNPVMSVVRLTVAPRSGESEIVKVRLAWDSRDTGRQRATVSLRLPAVGESVWDSLASDVTVEEQAALLMVGRAKREAARRSEQGDYMGSKECLAGSHGILMAVRMSPVVAAEFDDLKAVEALLDEGNSVEFRKAARYQSHRRSHSKPEA